MLVNPGFGGQKTIVSQIEKLRNIRNTIKAKKKEILLEVDGGVNIKLQCPSRSWSRYISGW